MFWNVRVDDGEGELAAVLDLEGLLECDPLGGDERDRRALDRGALGIDDFAGHACLTDREDADGEREHHDEPKQNRFAHFKTLLIRRTESLKTRPVRR